MKFGVYDDDRELFDWMRIHAPEGVRCIEAEVMDLSDDIGYSVHDFEDAIVSGYLDPQLLASEAGEQALLEKVAAWSGGVFGIEELREARGRLAGLDEWPTSWDASRQDAARLKNLTSRLIGRFARAATAATREAHEQPSLARYRAHVVVPRQIAAEIATLKGIVGAYVMGDDRRQPAYARQREVLTELAETLWKLGESGLDVAFVADWRSAADDAARKRVIVDQVASLTDQSALSWHARLLRRSLLNFASC